KVRYTPARASGIIIRSPMADKDTGGSPLEKSARALQHTAEQAGPAAGAGYTLIGAILLLGFIGYRLHPWPRTSPWGLIVGLPLGVVAGMYELAKTVSHKGERSAGWQAPAWWARRSP